MRAKYFHRNLAFDLGIRTTTIAATAQQTPGVIACRYENNRTLWVHITATSTRSSTVLLYTDMPSPLVTTPASLTPQLIGAEGHRNIYRFSLQPLQAVLLQSAGSTRMKPPYVLNAVEWPPIDGATVVNYWGKHRRDHLPPSPPPSPPPPPPPPPIKCSHGKSTPPGYACYANACNSDDGRVRTGSCGSDICNPAPKSPATIALCAEVDNTHDNATAIAAARCDAFEGCHSFGTSQEYSPSQSRCPTTSGRPLRTGVCFKFFRSGSKNMTSGTHWTLFAKA